MAALLYNLVRTTLGAPLTSGGTTITFDTPLQEGGVNVPTLSGDYIWLKINDELMHLTAYTAGATTGTVLRAQGNTIAANHNDADPVGAVATKAEFAAGGGGQSSTILIAADDSSARDIAAADFTCDAVNDQVQFQAAYDLLDNLLGGTIELAPGNYYVGATTNLNDAPVTFRGGIQATPQQMPETKIYRAANANFPMFTIAVGGVDHVAFEDLGLWDDNFFANNSPVILASNVSALSFTRCAVYNDQTSGVSISLTSSSSKVAITDSIVYSEGNGINASAVQVELEAFRTYFGSNLANALNLVSLTANSDIKLVSCFCDDGVNGYRIDGDSAAPTTMPRVSIIGGECYGTSQENIYLTDCLFVHLEGIHLGEGGHTAVRLNNVDGGVLSSLNIQIPGHHGIWMEACDDVLTEGNVINGASNGTNNTYSGVLLDTNTNRCQVLNNKIRSQNANKALYGIRIGNADCDDNFIGQNDLLGASNTAGNEVSNLGTGTRGHEVLTVAISDETTAITTGAAKMTFRMPFAMCLDRTRAFLSTVSSSGIPAFDINETGSGSIFSTTLTIDANEKTSTTAATAAVITDRALADDAEITIDIDTAGTGATGAKISLYGWRV